jgi:hypothetical protein
MEKPHEKLPRYNHYVPRFILENFTSAGQLSILDKHTLKQFKLPPYRAMGEKDFTNVRIGESVLSFENRFTYIEDQAAPIIAQIVTQRSLTFLTPMDEAILHTFVVVQFLRSKRRRLDQAAVGAEIRRRWPEIDQNPLKEEMSDDEFEKFAALDATFSKLDELAAALISKHFYLIIKDCAGDLYISDNPAVMHNSKQYGPYGNIGLAVPHIEIYYPLSPEVVLAYMCPLSMKETEEAHTTSESETNLIFSKRFLSPAGLSLADRLEIESRRKEIRRAKDYYAMIKNERVAPMNPDVLLFLNSLQVLSSFRYIACSRKNFDFAIKALSERPHWREGIGVQFA